MSRSAEASFLSAVLLDPGLALEHGDIPPLVFERQHRLIWEGIRSLLDRGVEISVLSVRDELERAGTLADAGGAEHLARLDREMPPAGYAPQALERIWDGHYRRQAVELAELIRKTASSSHMHGREVYARVLGKLRSMDVETNGAEGHISAPMKVLEDRYSSEKAIVPPGIPTGLRRLDDILGGLKPGKLYMLGAHPRTGKTAFVVNAIRHIAGVLGEPVGFATLEMSEEEIALRLAALEAGVSVKRAEEGRLTEAQRLELVAALVKFGDAPIHLLNNLDPPRLYSWARRLHVLGKLRVLIIDYLQLMGEMDPRTLSEIVRQLKILAGGDRNGGGLNIPVVLLTQISDKSLERDDRRPRLRDTAWAPGSEAHADVVAYLHRPELYFDPFSDPERAKPGEAVFIIAKQRSGPEGDCWTHFDAERMEFS